MKRILLALSMAMLVFATTGCKKDVRMYTSYYTVEPKHWVSANNLDYSYAPFENENITTDVIENGCVLVYLVDSDGRDNPLPYEIFRQDNSTDNYYSETFSYDASVENGVGTITFKFEASDFDNAASLSQIGNTLFKVCVLENNR